MAADSGTGTIATFGTSAFSGELTNVDFSGISRPSLKTSHMGTTTFDTFISGDLTDPGEISLDFLFEPDDTPLFTAVAETLTITFPLESGQTNAATWASTVFATDTGVVVPLEDLMTMSQTFKLSGAIVIVAAT